MTTALITGASRGLGFALARALAVRGWNLVLDGRDAVTLGRAREQLRFLAPNVVALPGDVRNDGHRLELATAVEELGDGLDLLVNNASELGPLPLRALAELETADLADIYAVNVFAPVALIGRLLPRLAAGSGIVINVSSDAAAEAYPGWGGYGSAKAALDQATAVFAVEHPGLRWYAVDPGDMRTDLHAAAVPEDDPQQLPLPAAVVPALLHLVDQGPPSGRYRAADLLPEAAGDGRRDAGRPAGTGVPR